LAASEVTSKKIIIPKGAATVGLVLEKNKIAELAVGDTGSVPLFESIAKKGGDVYLKENTITTCTCAAVSSIKTYTGSRIHYTTNPVCDSNKSIETCPWKLKFKISMNINYIP